MDLKNKKDINFVRSMSEMDYLAEWLNLPHENKKFSSDNWLRKKVEEIIAYTDTQSRKRVTLFNQLIKENPVILQLERQDKDRRVNWMRSYRFREENPVIPHMEEKDLEEGEIFAGFRTETTTGSILSLIWRIFINGDWKRFKQCPQCKKWFVDKTRNKKKDRCSAHCTWQWWSRERRKEEGHKISKVKIKRRRKRG